MVATSQPLAAQAGLDILRRGGNAVDAAVAAAAMLTLTEPGSTHLGGDAFALVYDAAEGGVHALNASGWAPAAWTPERFAHGVPAAGADSVTVPGVVDGWEKLLLRFGTMTFPQVLAPAIRDAEQGFGVGERAAIDWERAAPLLRADPDRRRRSWSRAVRPRRTRSIAIRASPARCARSPRTAATASTPARSPRRSSPSCGRRAASWSSRI